MSLQEAMHSLVQGIIVSQEARAASLATLRAATAAQREAARDQLHDLHGAHQAMAKRQRAGLAKARAGLAQGETRRKSDVIDWIKDVASAHQAMAKRQRASLAKARAGLVQGEARRKSDVLDWMREVTADHAGAATEWRGMIATMRAPEAGAAPVVKAPPRKAPAPPAAAEEKGAGPVSMRDRVFDHLAGRPDGARLTDMEQEFGVSRFQMTRALRDLTDKGKVEKRGALYFAI